MPCGAPQDGATAPAAPHSSAGACAPDAPPGGPPSAGPQRRGEPVCPVSTRAAVGWRWHLIFFV